MGQTQIQAWSVSSSKLFIAIIITCQVAPLNCAPQGQSLLCWLPCFCWFAYSLQWSLTYDGLTDWRVLAICCTTNRISSSSSSYEGEKTIWSFLHTSCIQSCGKLSLLDSSNRYTHVAIVRVNNSFSWTGNHRILHFSSHFTARAQLLWATDYSFHAHFCSTYCASWNYLASAESIPFPAVN